MRRAGSGSDASWPSRSRVAYGVVVVVLVLAAVVVAGDWLAGGGQNE